MLNPRLKAERIIFGSPCATASDPPLKCSCVNKLGGSNFLVPCWGARTQIESANQDETGRAMLGCRDLGVRPDSEHSAH